MTEITNNELKDLRDSNNLVVGQVYKLTDYSGGFPIYMTTIDEKTFEDESYTDNPDIILHYDLDSGTVDYMKDITRKIEGNFDWSSNVEGEVSDIYFENANLLHVKDSSNVVCEDSVGSGSTVSNSSNIIIGDGATVSINNSLDIVVGGNSTVNISGSTSVTIGERNTLTITDTTAISVGDDNENVILGNYNKIGSRNRNVALNGENNIIKSDDYNLIIEGDLNEVNKSRFVNIGGSFNNIEKSDLTKLNNASGNKITNSSSVDIVNTNNNSVYVRNIIIQDKPAFLKYSSPKNSSIKRVKNLIEKVNLQSDNEGRTLIIDEQKFYGETGSSGTKYDVQYELVNGIWVEVKS
jgi:hypothetical protein